MAFLLAAVFVAALAGANGEAMSLNNGNFDAEVFNSGKNSIVKFLAPWWGHCKSMKPAYDKLGAEYEGSSSVVIGDVDCTVEQDLCSTKGVQGYPTIKYYTSETGKEGKDYNSGRDYDALKKFVQDELEVKCLVTAPTEGCTEKEQEFIKKNTGKDAETIKKALARLEGMKSGSMKPELKAWLVQRINVLKQL